MTPIYCSNKLAKLIGNLSKDNSTDIPIPLLGGWNAHLFALDGRKCVGFVNNQTYYSVFIKDVLKKDLLNMEKLFVPRLIQQLEHDGLIKPEAHQLIEKICSPINLHRTNNDRRTIGVMNDFISTFKYHRKVKYQSLAEMDSIYESGLINDIPSKYYNIEDKRFWSFPIERFKEKLDNLNGSMNN